jgi:hypothetical protein
MTRRYSPSSEIAHLLAELRGMTNEEILDIHGIEINEDKSVYDLAYDQTFKNVQTWATFVVEQENSDYEDEDEYGKWDEEE